MLKTLLYLFLFLACLLAFTYSLFIIGGYFMPSVNHFMWLFLLTFVSLGGAILFGYAFMIHANEKK